LWQKNGTRAACRPTARRPTSRRPTPHGILKRGHLVDRQLVDRHLIDCQPRRPPPVVDQQLVDRRQLVDRQSRQIWPFWRLFWRPSLLVPTYLLQASS
jgi:hypothetical protein